MEQISDTETLQDEVVGGKDKVKAVKAIVVAKKAQVELEFDADVSRNEAIVVA